MESKVYVTLETVIVLGCNKSHGVRIQFKIENVV
jgi:hypothetical protein